MKKMLPSVFGSQGKLFLMPQHFKLPRLAFETALSCLEEPVLRAWVRAMSFPE